MEKTEEKYMWKSISEKNKHEHKGYNHAAHRYNSRRNEYGNDLGASKFKKQVNPDVAAQSPRTSSEEAM